MAGKDGRFAPWTSQAALALDVFLIVAEHPPDILAEYARLTGFPHLPPIWALGYQQSHRTLASREEVLSEAKTFRQKKLPCDALIYLGTGFCPSGWNTGHGSFVFNNRAFPDPAAMIRELHQEDLKIVLHVVNPPEGLHGQVSDAGAAVLIDFCRGTPAYTHREACQDKAARTVPVIHTVLNEEWWSCRSEPRCCAPRMGLT